MNQQTEALEKFIAMIGHIQAIDDTAERAMIKWLAAVLVQMEKRLAAVEQQ